MSRSTGTVAETKPRGPNRTTKTAGKLKVLPEQPEPSAGPKSPRVARDLAASQSRTESSESEEEGDDEAEDEPEADAEVCIILSDDKDIDVISHRSTTNWILYLLAQPVGMLVS